MKKHITEIHKLLPDQYAAASYLKEIGDINQDEGPPNYKTLMDYAIELQREEVIDFLLTQNDLAPALKEQAFIHYAAMGNLEKVKYLAESQAVDMNCQDKSNAGTALTFAIENDMQVVAEYLIKHSHVRLNVFNYMHETPLTLTILNESSILFDVLLAEIKNKDLGLNEQSYLYGTSLLAAIYFKQYDKAKKLLEIEEIFNSDYHPGALNWAIHYNQIDLVRIMCEKGADVTSTSQKNVLEVPEWVWQCSSTPSPFDRESQVITFASPLELAHSLSMNESNIVANIEMLNILNQYKEKCLISINSKLEDKLEQKKWKGIKKSYSNPNNYTPCLFLKINKDLDSATALAQLLQAPPELLHAAASVQIIYQRLSEEKSIALQVIKEDELVRQVLIDIPAFVLSPENLYYVDKTQICSLGRLTSDQKREIETQFALKPEDYSYPHPKLIFSELTGDEINYIIGTKFPLIKALVGTSLGKTPVEAVANKLNSPLS